MRKLFIHVRILPMNLPAMEVNQYRKRKPMELEPCSREWINFHQDCCTTGKMQTVVFGVFEFSRPAKIIAKAVHNSGRRARRKVLLTSSSRVPDMAGPSAQNQHETCATSACKGTGLPALPHLVRAFSLQRLPTLRLAGGRQRGPPAPSALQSFGEALPGALYPVLQSLQ